MKKGYYFTTKDLLFIAGFSAIGGLASTYLNMLGDFFQSLLGFAGTTQWAAGIHILWILLAVGIVNKPGTAVLLGIIKGIVELLSGNTHGVLVLIVDVVAGLIVELVFLLPVLSRSVKNILAGGLAAMSNVFVFQIFASVPADSLAFWSMLAVAGIALLSGVIFGGLLSQVILKNLAKTGVISPELEKSKTKWAKTGFVLLGILICAVAAFVYVQTSKGEGAVTISGNVAAEQSFVVADTSITPITVESSLQGKTGTYTGYPLRQIIVNAQPGEGADLVLVTATDGYSYFITMDEVSSNPNLILVVSGEGSDAIYSVVGAENSKAWVRGVAEVTIIQSIPIPIYSGDQPVAEFHAQDWQFEMDSVHFSLEEGSKKLQGVAVNKVLAGIDKAAPYTTIQFLSADGSFDCDLASVQADDSIRIFVNIDGYQMKYLVGTIQGEVFLVDVERIDLK
jgi:ABC-type thiamin/hydroxymethylpyrimidine transport system permease subunit